MYLLPSNLRVSDTTDDDPDVWRTYADGLRAALEYLLDLGNFKEDYPTAEEFQAEASSRGDDVRAWIDAIEQNRDLRRADVIVIADNVGLPSTSSRSGTIEKWRTAVIENVRLLNRNHLASISRPF